jgi:hypothetical protein
MGINDLAVELLEGLRQGRDLADVRLEPAFDYARRLNSRAELESSTQGELRAVAEAARACVDVLHAIEVEHGLPSDLDAIARRAPLPDSIHAVAQDAIAARECWQGPELLVKLAQLFDRARFIASSRRRTLRTGRDEFVTFSDHGPRRDILPALSVDVQRRRGPSRGERPGRRTRAHRARAPARPGDEPPPPDRLSRPSERRTAC